ncbi:MAG: aminotransferase class IV [Bacteroidia bacterium]|jgi:branched-chain amino acid aminotransferase
MQQFVNHNGIFAAADAPLFTSKNRAFSYGDAVFETVRFTFHRPQFLNEHLQRLNFGMNIFKMQAPVDFSESFFETALIELAKKNNIGSDGRARITVYRNDGGFYTPEDNSVSYLLEILPMEEKGYMLNQKGYTVDVYTELKKSPGALASIKSANSAMYIMAGIYKKTNGLDECILTNDKGYIIEAISSNLFAVKNGVLYTSPVTDGCVNGVMRKKIIDIAQTNRIAVYELSITQSVLLGADELFLTNAVNGIRWVVAYKQKRYFNDTSKKLTEKLNELAAKSLVNG